MSKVFDDLVNKLKIQLKKMHPDWDDEKINSMAYAMATKQSKKESKKDESGNIIVAENVKLILNANITGVGDIIEG